MNKYSPLTRGDVIPLSTSALKRATARFPDKLFKRLGFAVQYTHDAEFAAAGLQITPSSEMELFDRVYNGGLQDDKVATWYDKDGELKGCPTEYHFMSNDEVMRWNRQIREQEQDVIIQSFVFTDDSHSAVMYMGAISWWRARNFARQNKDDGRWSLQRESAYKHNLVSG